MFLTFSKCNYLNLNLKSIWVMLASLLVILVSTSVLLVRYVRHISQVLVRSKLAESNY
jgi:hypothetical protein